MRSQNRLLPILLLCAGVAVASAQGQGSSQQQTPPQQNSGANAGGIDGTQTASLADAQAAVQQQVVPLRDETHHLLVMQNDLVRVYTVGIPPNDATANHRHDHPYLAINFGAANIENDVDGKPPATLQLADGQLVYSAGGFAHIAKTAAAPFHNVTIELLKPQQNAKNLCKQVIEGPLSCEQEEASKKAGVETASAAAKPGGPGNRKKMMSQAANATKASDFSDDDVPSFETDQVRADVITVSGQREYSDESPKSPALLVAMTNSNIDVTLGGQHVSFLHAGDTLWMPAGTARRVNDFLGTKSNFLLVTFKDAQNSPPPQQ
jgi:hypothetical protein